QRWIVVRPAAHDDRVAPLHADVPRGVEVGQVVGQLVVDVRLVAELIDLRLMVGLPDGQVFATEPRRFLRLPLGRQVLGDNGLGLLARAELRVVVDGPAVFCETPRLPALPKRPHLAKRIRGAHDPQAASNVAERGAYAVTQQVVEQVRLVALALVDYAEGQL